MRKQLGPVALVAGLILATAAPVSASGASVDRIEDFDTVLAVRFEDDFPLQSLMRADCAFTELVTRPDGSSTERLICRLSDDPVMIPEFQGQSPATAFIHGGGACLWTSDYWFARDGSIVLASSFSYTVAPSGLIHVMAEYASEPLDCE